MQLDKEQKDSLVELLEQCASVRDQNQRDMMVERLPLDLRVRIQRHRDIRSDVTSMVRHASDFPGGVNLLCDAVKRFEGDSRNMHSIIVFLESLKIRPPARSQSIRKPWLKKLLYLFAGIIALSTLSIYLTRSQTSAPNGLMPESQSDSEASEPQLMQRNVCRRALQNLYDPLRSLGQAEECGDAEHHRDKCDLVVVDVSVIDEARAIEEFHNTWINNSGAVNSKENRFPIIDIKLLNKGEQTRYVKRLEIRATSLSRVMAWDRFACKPMEPSWHYHFLLDTNATEALVSLPISQVIDPNAGDRFTVMVGQKEKVCAAYELEMSLIFDEDQVLSLGSHILVSNFPWCDYGEQLDQVLRGVENVPYSPRP